MEVMHESDAYNFPLDLATIEAPSTNGWDFCFSVYKFLEIKNQQPISCSIKSVGIAPLSFIKI